MYRILICSKPVNVSQPLDAGKFVEIKFEIPACGDIAGGGEMRIRVEASKADEWRQRLGLTCFNHLRFV